MRTTFTFNSAGQLIFGPGAIDQLGTVARRLGGRRAWLVSDQRLAAAGVVDAATKPLVAAGIELGLFDGGQAEPSIALAERCAAEAREFAPDLVIGLGGGSNLDLAKITSALVRHGGAVSDYVGEDRLPGPVLPLVAVPTTAGTGSEVSAASVLTDEARQIKVGVLSNYLRPSVALVDPRLTLSCPPQVTADSGIDALTHAIEAVTAVDNAAFPLPPGETSLYQGRHPLGDLMAEKAIRLIGAHLRTAVHQGHDLAAREGMSLGATLAGLAFSNVGVALVHALEYPVGGATHCSHGAGNGLLLPYVMRYNLPGRETEFAQIAGWLGEAVEGLSTADAAERAIVAVERLKADIGIPARLSELGVRGEQIPELARKALGIQRILRVNPRPVTEGDLVALLRSAL